MKAIRYDLELKAPVLATDIQGEPNSAVSLPYLPGALLRGAIVGRYLSQENQREFDAADSTARALFLNETTRYLNAYPSDPHRGRALPMLRSWRFDKTEWPKDDEQRRDIFCLESQPQDDLREEKIGEPFGWLEGSTVHRFRPARQLNVHTRRNARKGRATAEAGGDVYRYDALAEGLCLQAVIWTADELAEQLVELLQGATLWLGRARRAGYGEVLVKHVYEPQEDWRELNPEEVPDDVKAGGDLQVTVFSPVLLRDATGQAALDVGGTLERALNLPSGALQIESAEARSTTMRLSPFTFADTALVGGFNRKWGLPLPQHHALAAGSFVIYRSSVAIASEDLAELEKRGIGERRNEGYGQVIFNWQAKADSEGRLLSKDAAAPEPKPPTQLTDEETAIAKRIAQALLRQRLDAELQERINYTSMPVKPSNHQLARLRVVVRHLRRQLSQMPSKPLDVPLLERYLAQSADQRAGKTLGEARIQETDVFTPLPDWLLAQLHKATDKWSGYEVKLGDGGVSVPAKADEALAHKYALRLIDRVLHRAQKEQNDNG